MPGYCSSEQKSHPGKCLTFARMLRYASAIYYVYVGFVGSLGASCTIVEAGRNRRWRDQRSLEAWKKCYALSLYWNIWHILFLNCNTRSHTKLNLTSACRCREKQRFIHWDKRFENRNQTFHLFEFSYKQLSCFIFFVVSLTLNDVSFLSTMLRKLFITLTHLVIATVWIVEKVVLTYLIKLLM